MESPLWSEVEPSQFAWEREALAFLKAGLPNHEPYRAWSNFEFVADDGSVNEVDALVIGPQGLFLVEIKSHPGVITGDQQRWTWTRPNDGGHSTFDNPLLAANRKARKLRSLLQRQPAYVSAKVPTPWVEPLVFLSSASLDCRLHDIARPGVTCRDDLVVPERVAFPPLPGVLKAVRDPQSANIRPHPVDRPASRRLADALGQIGIRPTSRHRRLGDWELGELLDEGDGWQDYVATRGTVRSQRRVRVYLAGRAHTKDEGEQLRRTAQREFVLLEPLRHPGVAQPLDLQQHEWGPALIFERAEGEERLDLWAATNLDGLGAYERIGLVRSLGEALDYAHRHNLTHRALAPRNVLVRPDPAAAGGVQLVISNWQSATRVLQTTLTKVPNALSERLTESDEVFLAPEVAANPDRVDGVAADVFSLGALAYLLLSGRPPGRTPLERTSLLQQHGYLPLDVALDGASAKLTELVAFATQADAGDRYGSAGEFLADLEDALDELTRGEEPTAVDPLEASRGDVLDGGWTVLRRLGKGSTALALLVERGGAVEVLKVALDEDHADRLAHEARTLGRLKDRGVVACHGVERVGGRTALRLEPAGDVSTSGSETDVLLTLADRLRRDGRVGLDLLGRFGEDLLAVVALLEDEGVAHRDLKPDNLGVRQRGKNDELHLVLFDFSLSGTPADQIRAGTPGYLDPFLEERRPRRWDLAAERYAAAVTLYEMATGVRPEWGDGRSDPLLLEDLVPRIESDLFDVAVRDGLTAFFGEALHRKPVNRFDTAAEMVRAWVGVFARPATTATTTATTADPGIDPAEVERLVAMATDRTPVGELGLSAAALGVLERLGLATAGDLGRLPANDLVAVRGVGNRVRAELRTASRRLAEHLDALPEADEHAYSIDSLLTLCVPRGTAPAVVVDVGPTRELLGLDGDGSEAWPSLKRVADRFHLDRVAADDLLERARKRWQKHTALTGVRDDIDAVLAASGGLGTGEEVAHALLDRRGSPATGAERLRRARAVVRAAVEAEAGRAGARFGFRRLGTTVVLYAESARVDAQELIDYAAALGPVADDLARTDPLASPAVAVERLRAVPVPFGFELLTDTRLVRLAAAASQAAAVSSRLELYPRGMAAERALGLARAALLGVGTLNEEQLRDRVRTRFPDAAALPERPALDRLVADTVGLEWFAPAGADQGGYRVPPPPEVSSGSSVFGRSVTRYTRTAAVPDDDRRIATDTNDRLLRSVDGGGFLTITTSTNRYLQAERDLGTAFALDVVDVDAALLAAMHAEAGRKNIRWADAVIPADAAGPGGQRWANLLRVARAAAAEVEADVLARPAVLLTRPGLLARYGLLDGLVDRLRDRTTVRAEPGQVLRSVWLLAAAEDPTATPTVDGAVVPVQTPTQWMPLPEPWLRGAHRHPGAA